MSSINTTATAPFELWFIFVDISAIIALVFAVLLAVCFLTVVVLNKTCQTIPTLLTCASFIAEIVLGCNMMSIAIFSLENDRKRRIFQDPLCVFRDYLGYVGTGMLLYSLTLQALYRYIIVVYPRRLFWQSISVQGVLVCFCWIFCITSLLPWFLAGYSTYDVNNQLCMLPFRRAIPVIYNVSIVYLIPLCFIILIYVKLVRYVHRMDSHNGSSTQTVFQARRELTVVKRIVTIISVLVIFGLPFTFFMFLSFVTTPPKYHYRFSLLSSELLQTVIVIGLFRCSQPVVDVLLKFKRRFSNINQLSNKNSSAEK